MHYHKAKPPTTKHSISNIMSTVQVIRLLDFFVIKILITKKNPKCRRFWLTGLNAKIRLQNWQVRCKTYWVPSLNIVNEIAITHLFQFQISLVFSIIILQFQFRFSCHMFEILFSTSVFLKFLFPHTKYVSQNAKHHAVIIDSILSTLQYPI